MWVLQGRHRARRCDRVVIPRFSSSFESRIASGNHVRGLPSPARLYILLMPPSALAFNGRGIASQMSVRSELVRFGLRWLIKHRNHRELTLEQHRRFVAVAERLVR